MKARTIVAMIAVAALLCACFPGATIVRGSGNVVTDERRVSGVTGVVLTTSGDLSIELGDSEGLRVEAEDNLQEYYETVMRGNVLYIQVRQNTGISATRPVRYYLTVKGLSSLATTSSGNISAPALEATDLNVTISSSGDVTLAGLQAETLAIKISSSGNLSIAAGEAKDVVAVLSSSGDYDGGNVRSQTADVKISSSGNATLWVTDKLVAGLSSSGNVEYYGDPRVTANTSSSGRVVGLGSK